MARTVAERDALALRWLALVDRIARKDFRECTEYRDDLIGAGRMALLLACEDADEGRPTVKNYLARHIRWAMLAELRRARCLGAPAGELADLWPDRRERPADAAQRREDERAARELVGRLLPSLGARDRLAIRLVFGLGGDPPMNQAELAEQLGISRERASQIMTRALVRMEAAARGDRPAPRMGAIATRDRPEPRDPIGDYLRGSGRG